MINIYLMKTEEFLEEERFQLGCGLVDETRLQKIHACKSTEDKVRSLCCGLLLQYTMKKELAADGRLTMEDRLTGDRLASDSDIRMGETLALRYEKGEQGKPYFVDYPQIYFNLSHSGEYVVLALAGQEIGIDIQKKRPVKESFAKRVLAEPELAEYERRKTQTFAEAGRKMQDWLFRCWCAKESFCKLTGKGLSQELREVIFEPQQGRIRGERSAFCREYAIGTEYCCNVCTYEKEEFPEKLTYLTFAHILS